MTLQQFGYLFSRRTPTITNPLLLKYPSMTGPMNNTRLVRSFEVKQQYHAVTHQYHATVTPVTRYKHAKATPLARRLGDFLMIYILIPICHIVIIYLSRY